LSADSSISCASCHQQRFGFTDTTRTSRGIHGRKGRRRTLPLVNARFNYAGRFFWDERAASLEKQVLEPVLDSLEMGMANADLRERLSSIPLYQQLFAAAFGSTEITNERISKALAQFVRSLISSQSRFDAVYPPNAVPDPGALTDVEREGQRLFLTTGCVNCHRTVVQIADQPTNNGLDRFSVDTGAGKGRFKPASLRNVAIRPPYMHDGRFASLERVVQFYSSEVNDNPDLDPRMRGEDGFPRRLNLSRTQVDALVAFLRSLTDTAFLRDARFSDPFACPP
jgi:cytochrome c peroxidase